MKKKVILDAKAKQKLLSQGNPIRLDWESNTNEGIIIRNKKLGVTLCHYAVLDENNNFKYDTFGIEERESNCISIVLNQKKEICLLKEYRFMPGKYFLSCPRGFSESKNEKRLDCALREVKEEVGDFKIIEIVDLGDLYQNTTFFIRPIGVILIKLEINKKIETSKSQESEDIKGVEFFKPEEVQKMIKEGKIECLMTLGALSKYFSHI